MPPSSLRDFLRGRLNVRFCVYSWITPAFTSGTTPDLAVRCATFGLRLALSDDLYAPAPWSPFLRSLHTAIRLPERRLPRSRPSDVRSSWTWELRLRGRLCVTPTWAFCGVVICPPPCPDGGRRGGSFTGD